MVCFFLSRVHQLRQCVRLHLQAGPAAGVAIGNAGLPVAKYVGRDIRETFTALLLMQDHPVDPGSVPF